METIRGEFVRFLKKPTNPGDRGFALVRIDSSGQMIDSKVGGVFSPLILEGEWFLAEGSWKESSYRGKSDYVFNASGIFPDMPVTALGAETLFLRTFNEKEHGISHAMIKAYVQKHGARSALVAEQNVELLFRLSTDPAKFKAAIEVSWRRRISAREPMRVMEGAGVSSKTAKTVIKAYRDNALSILKKDPYQIIELPKVAFSEADQLAVYMKVPADDHRRVRAAVKGAALVSWQAGHTCFNITDFMEYVPAKNIDVKTVFDVVRHDQNWVVHPTANGVYLQSIDKFNSERNIATKISELLEAGRRVPKDEIDKVAQEVLSDPRYARFDDIQRQAVITSSRESVAVLTGGPGTGKSTVTEAIAEIAARTAKGPVILMAPTGKAAGRLAETTGKNATTVHRGLKAFMSNGTAAEYKYNKANPLPSGCFVIIDESSMLDVDLTSALMDAIPEDGRVLFVGDKYQLESVGAGYVLGDIIGAKGTKGAEVPCSELKNVYRSSSDTDIAVAAAQIREGTYNAETLTNYFRKGIAMFDVDSKSIVEKVEAIFTDANLQKLGIRSLSEIAVLCPQRSGSAGTHEINYVLSRKLNPKGKEILGLEHGPDGDKREPLPRVGDRVMMTRNDYENDVMNGDTGSILGVKSEKDENGRTKRYVEIKFDLYDEVVRLPISRARDLILAYAITGHKSQGSQYKTVVMPFSRDHEKMLNRTLVYTEWTRAKNFLILCGEREVLSKALGKVSAGQRRTMLKQLLSESLSLNPQDTIAQKKNGDGALPQIPTVANKPSIGFGGIKPVGLKPVGLQPVRLKPMGIQQPKLNTPSELPSSDEAVESPKMPSPIGLGRPKIVFRDTEENYPSPKF